MNFYNIAIAVLSVVGVIVLLTKQKKEKPIDPYADYQLLSEAAFEHKESTGEFAKNLTQLVSLINSDVTINTKRYSLSLDGKFLVVNGLEVDEANSLINIIGGDSYINGKLTYLTLVRKAELSKIVPIAHFTVKPEGKIYTTTFLTYDTTGCIAEEGEVVEKKWENKLSVFHEPGTYVIKLNIKDKNGNWSDAFERTIKVIEENGISGIESYDSSLFITYVNGKILCKGKNEYGQLGIGTLNSVPELVHNSFHDGIVEVACGEGFNVYRFYDGTVCTAGTNRHGELATGDKNAQKTLASVWGLENIKQVAAGKRFAAALDVFGSVYVWGDNSDGQLMRDDLIDTSYPLKLEGVEGVKQIACGLNFGLALKYDGTVMAWGDNSFGQLGIGLKGKVFDPVVTLYTNAKSVHAGDRFSMIVTENGRVFGTGNNAYGQLGAKGKNEILFPSEVLRLKDVETLRVKESLVLAITTTGKAYLWGNFNAPAMKPIYEPVEIPGVSYAKAYANNGRKCYIIDGMFDMHSIVDLSGKNEKMKVHENIYEFVESHSKKA